MLNASDSDIAILKCDFQTDEFLKFSLDGSLNDDRDKIWEFIFGEDWENCGGGSRETLIGNTFSWTMDGVDCDAFENLICQLDELHPTGVINIKGYDENNNLIDEYWS